MPLYNYYCEVCGFDFEYFRTMAERSTATCPSCGCSAAQAPSTSAYHAFPEGVFEHIGPDPLVISDKRQLRSACDEHECYAPGILD